MQPDEICKERNFAQIENKDREKIKPRRGW